MSEARQHVKALRILISEASIALESLEESSLENLEASDPEQHDWKLEFVRRVQRLELAVEKLDKNPALEELPATWGDLGVLPGRVGALEGRVENIERSRLMLDSVERKRFEEIAEDVKHLNLVTDIDESRIEKIEKSIWRPAEGEILPLEIPIEEHERRLANLEGALEPIRKTAALNTMALESRLAAVKLGLEKLAQNVASSGSS